MNLVSRRTNFHFLVGLDLRADCFCMLANDLHLLQSSQQYCPILEPHLLLDPYHWKHYHVCFCLSVLCLPRPFRLWIPPLVPEHRLCSALHVCALSALFHLFFFKFTLSLLCFALLFSVI